MKNKMLRVLVSLCMCAAMMIMPVTSFAADTEDITEPEAVVNEEVLENLADELQNDAEPTTESEKAAENGKQIKPAGDGEEPEDIDITGEQLMIMSDRTVGNITGTGGSLYLFSSGLNAKDITLANSTFYTYAYANLNAGNIDFDNTYMFIDPRGCNTVINCGDITSNSYAFASEFDGSYGTTQITARDVNAGGIGMFAWDAGGNIFISARNLKGTYKGLTFIRADPKGEEDAERYGADIFVEDTLYGEDAAITIRYDTNYEIDPEHINVTAWKVEAGDGNPLVTGTEEAFAETAAAIEESINYIIKTKQPTEGGTLSVSGVRTVHDKDTAKEGEIVRLNVDLEDGYKIAAAYNNDVPLEKDDEGYYLVVPKGGGVLLSVELVKEDVDPTPTPDPDPDSDTDPSDDQGGDKPDSGTSSHSKTGGSKSANTGDSGAAVLPYLLLLFICSGGMLTALIARRRNS